MTTFTCKCGNNKHYAKGVCKRCYYQNPEVKARRREYQREYRNRPEVKARKREYQREYCNRPEVKARRREYQREYDNRPEVKASRFKKQADSVDFWSSEKAKQAFVMDGELLDKELKKRGVTK